MNGTVLITGKAKKQTDNLSGKVREVLFQLVQEIGTTGPVRGDWPNYSKLSGDRHHCHLKKGKPCYVAIWWVDKGKIRFIEVHMQEPTKKHHTENDIVTLRLKVHRSNAAKVKEFVRALEEGKERAYSVAEVFPEYISQGKTIALRAYRTREDLTQRELAEKVGIPQRHISEMENGKRPIGKEMAKRFSEALGVDYRV